MPQRSKQGDPIVSAQVIVRSQSGKEVQGDTPITSENLEQYAPSFEDVAVVENEFKKAGFHVGTMVGISFAISAPMSRFARFFETKLRIGKEGEVAIEKQRVPSGGLELPLEHLPPEVTRRVVAVTFAPPAELHDKPGSALF